MERNGRGKNRNKKDWDKGLLKMIIFRELRDDDRKILQNFLNSLSEETLNKWRHYSGEIIDEIYKEFSHKLIGLDDGKIVVYGCLIPNDNYPDTPALGIVVTDEYQGRGVGSLMMRELENLATEKSYKFIFLTAFKSNHHAYNLYKKMGYEVIDEVERYGIPAYAMKKDIGEKMVKEELKLIHSYKLKEKKLKILLHAPLHPSYWVYLMETLPEHKWFIEPNENFEEGGTPRNHIKYTVVPREAKIKYDVQIFCLNSHQYLFQNLMKNFGHVPIVFLDFYGTVVPPLKIKYPLISCCRSDSNRNRNYPNSQVVYVSPSRTLWNRDWKGDRRKIFIPSQRYLEPAYAHTYAAKLIPRLMKTDLKLDVVLNKTRTIPWKRWQRYFIHDRVLLDIADKHSSFVLQEAMTIGTPVISRNMFESPYIIRDKVDGFIKWTEEELIELLHKFLEDDSFANKWSLKSKERGKEVLSAERTRTVFNRAFQNAIELFHYYGSFKKG